MTEPTTTAKLGTFGGVFTPTVLTILGVILYLRLGWVIGNGGLIGGLLVIGLAVGITAATNLALSSIATNTRLGAGGPYAIISRSLGLEVGGSRRSSVERARTVTGAGRVAERSPSGKVG